MPARKLFSPRERDLVPPNYESMSLSRSHAWLLALTTLSAAAWGEAPNLSVEPNQQLSISEVPPGAPVSIEITGDAIVPIFWQRGSQTQRSLPLLLLPGTGDELAVRVLSQSRSIDASTSSLPRVQVDANEYTRLSNWRPHSSIADRRTTLLVATAFAVTLLAATLLRRGRVVAVVGVSAAWTIGLCLAANAKPTLLTRDALDGRRWFLATSAQTLRVPIRTGEPWVPIVESAGGLKTLSPRIVVAGDATIEVSLSAGGKVGFCAP